MAPKIMKSSMKASRTAAVKKKPSAATTSRDRRKASSQKSSSDQPKQQTFAEEINDMGLAALRLNLIGIGHELGLFDHLMSTPKTSQELAASAGCDARYIKEWCIHMAATKVLSHTPDERFEVPERVREGLKEPSNMSMLYNAPAAVAQRPRLIEVFKSGEGISWAENDARLFCGTALYFQPLYEKNLVPNLPDEIRRRCEAGGLLADVGCGEGISCVVLAKAFPELSVVGYDYHGPSVEKARERAQGLPNATFETVDAQGFGAGRTFDMVTFFDCFHDMATASAAAKQAFNVLKSDGVVMLIEMLAAENDTLQEQICLPTAPIFSAFSCHVCLPCGKCNGGDALGTLCPTSKHRQIFVEAGFKSLESIDSPLSGMGFRVLLAHK